MLVMQMGKYTRSLFWVERAWSLHRLGGVFIVKRLRNRYLTLGFTTVSLLECTR